jgi:hypothetical protein
MTSIQDGTLAKKCEIDQRRNFGFNSAQQGIVLPSFASSFSLAYSLHVVGTYFDGAALLAQLGSGGSESLKAVCEAQLENLAQQGAATRLHIRRVVNALKLSEIESPPPPRTPDEYPAWVDAVTDRFYPLIEAESAPMSGYSLGWFLGAFVENANLAAFALMMQDESPEHPMLDETLQAMSDELSEAVAGFRQALDAEGLEEPLRQALTGALSHLENAPSVHDDAQAPLDIADDFQEVLFELGVAVETLEGLLNIG